MSFSFTGRGHVSEGLFVWFFLLLTCVQSLTDFSVCQQPLTHKRFPTPAVNRGRQCGWDSGDLLLLPGFVTGFLGGLGLISFLPYASVSPSVKWG